jgi:hypothetical protein
MDRLVAEREAAVKLRDPTASHRLGLNPTFGHRAASGEYFRPIFPHIEDEKSLNSAISPPSSEKGSNKTRSVSHNAINKAGMPSTTSPSRKKSLNSGFPASHAVSNDTGLDNLVGRRLADGSQSLFSPILSHFPTAGLSQTATSGETDEEMIDSGKGNLKTSEKST